MMTSSTPTRHFLDLDPRRLSILNAAHMTATGLSLHPRRTSIVNYHQRRNSQLRKASFTTSTLVCDKSLISLTVGYIGFPRPEKKKVDAGAKREYQTDRLDIFHTSVSDVFSSK